MRTISRIVDIPSLRDSQGGWPCVFMDAMNDELGIPAARVAAFVRQHAHDVRNGLNSLDLETGLLEEVVTDEEGRASVERMRKQLRALADQMRSLSALVQEPEPMAAPISARELFLIWREQHAGLSHPPEVRWVDELGDEKVCVDVSLMTPVFTELLKNAAAFSPLGATTATARRSGEETLFELREAKTEALDTSGWGQALSSTRRGGYGLGLWAVRRLVAANHATIMQRYDPEQRALVSRIAMPVV